ncbi:MAG: DUF423 domain-containing protein [Cyanobacteriota bacterium ELA615]
MALVEKIFLSLGCILTATSVMGGAFASHALKSMLTVESFSIWETALRYQMYHAFALILIGLLLEKPNIPTKGLLIAGYIIFVGIILFSGSLYLLSLSQIRLLGIITPLGGLALIVGWLTLTVTISLARTAK